MQEYKVSKSALFLTLTYDTAHVPITRNGFRNLNKRDLQLFFKRLRKNNGLPIRYYAVGEYGGRTSRPHYHVILFNAQPELIQDAWKIDGKHIGQIHYGQVSEASVGYTLKYISKDSRIPLHCNDDRQREFALMSKGLGENYLTQKMIAWHKKDLENRMYCNIPDGKKISMPRYYKDKIYHKQERKAAGVSARKLAEERELKMTEQDYRNKIQANEAEYRKHQKKIDQLKKQKL